MIKNIIIVITCFTLSYWVFTWLRSSEQQYSAALASEQSNSELVHRFSNLDTERFDKDGYKKFTLSAPSAAFKPDSQISLFRRPQITVIQAAQSPLKLVGDTGVIEHQSNNLTLSGHVVVTTNKELEYETELRTDELAIDFDKELAFTASPVTITRNQSTMQAVGMKLQLKSQKIHLLSSVRGQHDD